MRELWADDGGGFYIMWTKPKKELVYKQTVDRKIG